MRVDLAFSADEQTYLEFLGEQMGTQDPQATVAKCLEKLLSDLIDSEGPCLDHRRNSFEAWKAARGVKPVRCTRTSPCVACANLLETRW